VSEPPGDLSEEPRRRRRRSRKGRTPPPPLPSWVAWPVALVGAVSLVGVVPPLVHAWTSLGAHNAIRTLATLTFLGALATLALAWALHLRIISSL